MSSKIKNFLHIILLFFSILFFIQTEFFNNFLGRTSGFADFNQTFAKQAIFFKLSQRNAIFAP